MVKYNYNSAVDYEKFLSRIYGDKTVRGFTKIENNKVVLKKLRENRYTFQKEFRHSKSSFNGCFLCNNIYDNVNSIKSQLRTVPDEFVERTMEFPGWLGNLDFDKVRRKKIVLIGEDVSPRVIDQIHVAYDFGCHPITKREILRTDFFVYLIAIFIQPEILKNLNTEWDLREFQRILKEIYVTDTSKCHALKFQKLVNKDDKTLLKKLRKNTRQIWDNCSSQYLNHEINFIDPEIILCMGKIANKYCLKNLKKTKLRAKIRKLYHWGYRFLKTKDIIRKITEEHNFLKKKIIEQIINI